MSSKTRRGRGSWPITLLGLSGWLVAAIAAGVGIIILYEGVVRGSVPMVGVGIGGVLMGAILSFVLPDEFRKLGRGRHGFLRKAAPASGETIPDDFDSEHRRRKIAVAIAAIPMFLVLLLLLGWPIFSGAFQPTIEIIATLGFIIGGLLLVVIVSGLELLIHGRFILSERGFVPPKIPVRRALRGKRFVEFGEVAGVLFAPDPAGEEAFLRLADGVVVVLREREGIPQAELRKVLETLKARGISTREIT